MTIDLVAHGISIGVGLILLWAGVVKLRNRWGFVAAVKTWWPMSARSARVIGTSLPWLEAAIGVALVAAPFASSLRVPAGLAGLSLLTGFVMGQLVMLTGKHKATCGCFSPSAGVSPATTARAGMLATLVLASLVVASNPLGS